MDARTRARYEANLADLIAKRAKLSTALDSALENAEVQDYNLNDPEGGQQVRRRSPAELTTLLRDIDAQIDSIERQLGIGGIHIANMRRIP